jgi:hypothetical protein
MNLDENSITYSGHDQAQNSYLGIASKLTTVTDDLFHEEREKLFNYFNAHNYARTVHHARGVCFGKCVSDVMAVQMSSDEKNCLRECFLKRTQAREDYGVLAL